MNLPIEFVNSIKNTITDSGDFFRALNNGYYKGLRINNLKLQENHILTIMEKNLENVKWCSKGFYYDDVNISKNPFYATGLYYIQEPSAMLPVSALDIKEGDYILDLCAAPGGKATFVGERLRGSGLLVVNDISTSRCSALLTNLERHGISNYLILNDTSEKLIGVFGESFDKILIDAPCSGEGMFRKDPKAIKSWLQKGSAYYKNIQQKLLLDAACMVKPGGMLIYSSCTFNTIENEDNILFFLENHKDFEPYYLNHIELGISQGLKGLSFCGRIWPHRQKGEGHFLAIMKKKGKSLPNIRNNNSVKINSPVKLVSPQSVLEFFEENLSFTPKGNITLFGDSVMLTNGDFSDFKGIRVFRSGMDIGSIKKGRFEPAQALAMSLTPDQFKNSISFKRNDISVEKYLKGESLDFDGSSGWFLVCVEGFPLGFAKSDGRRLKNKLSRGWIGSVRN